MVCWRGLQLGVAEKDLLIQILILSSRPHHAALELEVFLLG